MGEFITQIEQQFQFPLSKGHTVSIFDASRRGDLDIILQQLVNKTREYSARATKYANLLGDVRGTMAGIDLAIYSILQESRCNFTPASSPLSPASSPLSPASSGETKWAGDASPPSPSNVW